ncbi:MAG: hypothetical protein KZQ96_17480 [Candidatus Thiodiazotropha sp. (ex Lucinoma borealis)]|nr:hypothetical protein [Candidatus Thiodiazotropha sp. (ex Lucinoma borealis)]MCU7867304.1 hypothetical protein [Candidatus Thiodiazotropha sp. (ex Lucinoma borealis)]
MAWRKITNEIDADELMDIFGGFHDACIREAHLYTEHYVNNDLSMNCPGNLDTSIRFVVQRQFKDPACIELLFEGVTRFNLVPTSDNYDSVIYEARIGIEKEEVYWSVDTNKPPSNCKANRDTWVSAKTLKWRPNDQYLGRELHFGNNT